MRTELLLIIELHPITSYRLNLSPSPQHFDGKGRNVGRKRGGKWKFPGKFPREKSCVALFRIVGGKWRETGK